MLGAILIISFRHGWESTVLIPHRITPAMLISGCLTYKKALLLPQSSHFAALRPGMALTLGSRGKFQWADFSPHPVRVLLCAYGKGSVLVPGPSPISRSIFGCSLFVFAAVLRVGKVTTGRFGEQDRVYGEQHQKTQKSESIALK